jgi:hypothetical protein
MWEANEEEDAEFIFWVLLAMRGRLVLCCV